MSVNLYRDLVEVIDYITNCFPFTKNDQLREPERFAVY